MTGLFVLCLWVINMMNKFYSNSFPFAFYSDSQKIKDIPKGDFEKTIDSLMFLSDIIRQTKIFQKPMNMLVAETDTEYVVAINFDKAVFGGNLIVNLLGKQTEDRVEEILKEVFFNEDGLHVDGILHLPISEFKQSIPIMTKIFNNNSEYLKRQKELATAILPNFVWKCVRKIWESEKSFAPNYGGDGMWINPIFKARELVVDPNMCFCILPFNSKRLELFDEVIKPNLEEKFNLTVIRSGNVVEPNLDIRENIWTYINKALFVIADLSDYNANVYYELGICHTLGKKVITLCDENSFKTDYNEKLPFDISTINTIFYKNSLAGPTKLLDSIDKNVKAVRENKPYID